MTVFDERPPTPNLVRRRLRLLVLPLLAGLAGLGILAAHSPHGPSEALREFRGEAPADPGPNRAMADALTVRRDLLMHPGVKLSPAHQGQLVAIVGSPVNDQSQSEALDVLSLAQRAHALSAAQSAQAQDAALAVLKTSPGPMVRLESARLLGHLGGGASIPALTRLLGDADPKVQDAAREALARSQR